MDTTLIRRYAAIKLNKYRFEKQETERHHIAGILMGLMYATGLSNDKKTNSQLFRILGTINMGYRNWR